MSSAVGTFEDFSRYAQNNELTERRNLDESELTNAVFEIEISKLNSTRPKVRTLRVKF